VLGIFEKFLGGLDDGEDLRRFFGAILDHASEPLEAYRAAGLQRMPPVSSFDHRRSLAPDRGQVVRDRRVSASEPLYKSWYKTQVKRGAERADLRTNIFERTMESLYEQGKCDQFRMCELGDHEARDGIER